MAKFPVRHLRKRRTREHVIADLSENFVERQVLLCGYTVERLSVDYGIDLMVETFNRLGEIENGQIFFQLKASDRTSITADGKSVLCRIDKADLLYWLGETTPVILIHYDARKNAAWWLHVQEDIQSRQRTSLFVGGKQMTVSIPIANVFDPAAVKTIARRKNARAKVEETSHGT